MHEYTIFHALEEVKLTPDLITQSVLEVTVGQLDCIIQTKCKRIIISISEAMYGRGRKKPSSLTLLLWARSSTILLTKSRWIELAHRYTLELFLFFALEQLICALRRYNIPYS